MIYIEMISLAISLMLFYNMLMIFIEILEIIVRKGNLQIVNDNKGIAQIKILRIHFIWKHTFTKNVLVILLSSLLYMSSIYLQNLIY